VVFAVIAMGTALLTVHHFSLQNGYWTGMTLLLCLRMYADRINAAASSAG
jgi:uncharacterized membrane protein YccC